MVDSDQTLTGSNGQKWHLQKFLGSGTCCSVYSAFLEDGFQSDCGVKAAVKVYKAGDKFRAAAFRERELLYLVNKIRGASPYLVELYDHFSWNDQCCLVEELLDCDLSTLYRERGLSLQEVHVLATHVSSGLDALHSCGFTHGDLKPRNIMWSSHTRTFKLIDFSLSFHSLDQHIPVLQSRPYRSPEVDAWNDHITSVRSQGSRGNSEEPVTGGVAVPGPSCDMWSLGCIIKKLLEKNSSVRKSSV